MLEPTVSVPLSELIIEQLMAKDIDQIDIDRLAALGLARIVYDRRYVSLGLAAELAGVEREVFVADLAARGIPLVNVPEDAVQTELNTVDSLLQRRSGQ